jgi:hypothetical protein
MVIRFARHSGEPAAADVVGALPVVVAVAGPQPRRLIRSPQRPRREAAVVEPPQRRPMRIRSPQHPRAEEEEAEEAGAARVDAAAVAVVAGLASPSGTGKTAPPA